MNANDLESMVKSYLDSLDRNKVVDLELSTTLFWIGAQSAYETAQNDVQEKYGNGYVRRGIALRSLVYDTNDLDKLYKYWREGATAKMVLVLKTEFMHIFNEAEYQMMKKYVRKARIIAADNCAKCHGGEVNIEDLVLPPYHPDCACTVEYIVKES